MNQSPTWQNAVDSLIRNAETEESEADALECYQHALSLIPDPKEDSTAATQIFQAMGEIEYLAGNFSQAFAHYCEAVRCRGGLGMDVIHLRLGQLRYERGEMDRAKDELMRAYMAAGELIFQNEDPKYFQLIRDVVAKKKT